VGLPTTHTRSIQCMSYGREVHRVSFVLPKLYHNKTKINIKRFKGVLKYVKISLKGVKMRTQTNEKGKIMIQKICKIDFSELDYISVKCKRCNGEFNYQSIDSELKGCPMCNKSWQTKEIEAVKELSNAYYTIKNANKLENFTISFVSIENA